MTYGDPRPAVRARSPDNPRSETIGRADIVTALNTFFLILGMAVIGVPIILGLLGPIAGAVVVRVFPESAWDGVSFCSLRVEPPLRPFSWAGWPSACLGLPA